MGITAAVLSHSYIFIHSCIFLPDKESCCVDSTQNNYCEFRSFDNVLIIHLSVVNVEWLSQKYDNVGGGGETHLHIVMHTENIIEGKYPSTLCIVIQHPKIFAHIRHGTGWEISHSYSNLILTCGDKNKGKWFISNLIHQGCQTGFFQKNNSVTRN